MTARGYEKGNRWGGGVIAEREAGIRKDARVVLLGERWEMVRNEYFRSDLKQSSLERRVKAL